MTGEMDSMPSILLILVLIHSLSFSLSLSGEHTYFKHRQTVYDATPREIKTNVNSTAASPLEHVIMCSDANGKKTEMKSPFGTVYQ